MGSTIQERLKPRAAVAATTFTRRQVGWYGGGTRRVQTLDGTGHWYKSGRGLVPLRWVFVRDQTGTHRDEYFFTTDPSMAPTAVVAHYCGRWNIETTFQEARSALGLGTTRGWREKTVLRAGPCLLGLHSVVAILFHALPASKRGGAVSGPGKATVTFSDARCAVRRWLWTEAVLPQPGTARPFRNCPNPSANCSSPRSRPPPERPTIGISRA